MTGLYISHKTRMYNNFARVCTNARVLRDNHRHRRRRANIPQVTLGVIKTAINDYSPGAVQPSRFLVDTTARVRRRNKVLFSRSKPVGLAISRIRPLESQSAFSALARTSVSRFYAFIALLQFLSLIEKTWQTVPYSIMVPSLDKLMRLIRSRC